MQRNFNDFILFRDPAQLTDQITTKGIVIFIFLKFHFQLFFHILQVCGTIDTVNIFFHQCNIFFFLFIVFVEDIAKDFFHDIFHGNDACCTAVFIDHDSHMHLFQLHFLQQFIYLFRERHIIRLHQKVFQMEIPFFYTGHISQNILHHILYMIYAHNIIDIVIVYHDTGIFFLCYYVFNIFQCCVQRYSNNICSMSRNTACRNVPQFKNVIDHLFFIFINGAIVTAGIYHLTDFFLCYGIFFALYHSVSNFSQKKKIEDHRKHQAYK